MIDVKDLRIGNLINSPNGIITVTSIESEFKEVKEGECTVNDYNVSELEPIPLTEQILLSCGFRRTGLQLLDSTPVEWELDYFHIYLSNGCYNWERTRDDFGSMMEGIEISHLHQLQNLYYCLTGTELLINLNAEKV